MTDSSDLKVADEPMDGDDKQACAPKPYGPITQALRDLMVESNQWLFGQTGRGHKTLSCSMQRFIEACNAIDAVHSALEEENKRLRKELGKRDLAKTIGETTVEVKMHLDFKTLARELESAAQAVYSVGARFADMKGGDDDE